MKVPEIFDEWQNTCGQMLKKLAWPCSILG
jgi:hypothetical protein